MVLPYLKGLIIKKHFYLFLSCSFLGLFLLSYILRSDLQHVVSEHFLGQTVEIYFFHFCRVSGVANLQIRSVHFGARSIESNYRSVFLVKKYPNSKKKSVESESG